MHTIVAGDALRSKGQFEFCHKMLYFVNVKSPCSKVSRWGMKEAETGERLT